MKEKNYPFKLTLAALFLDECPRCLDDVMAELSEQYAKARFFTRPFVANALQSLKAVCVLTADENSVYSIAPGGAERVRKNM